NDRGGTNLDPLSASAYGRWRDAVASAGTGGDTPSLRLATAACDAVARGRAREPQEAASALRRGTAAGSPAWRTQARLGHPGGDCVAAGSEPTLVTRLRQRHADRRQTVQDPGDGRRLYPGVPLPDG